MLGASGIKATLSGGRNRIRSPSLKSNCEGKYKKVEYFITAVAHVFRSFVARQRHTGLELVGGVWHEMMGR